MVDVPVLSESERRQAARDWSHSIQARLAETLMADIARSSGSSDTLTGSHRAGFIRTLIAAGATYKEAERTLAIEASAKTGEFDEPRVRDVVEVLANEVFQAMAAAGMPSVEDKLIFESLPSGSVTALCCANTWDDYFHVFVDSDLMVFCASISKIVSSVFTQKNGGAATDQPTRRLVETVRSPAIRHRIEDLFGSTVFLGTPKASRPWLPRPEAVRLHVMLNQTMERFVVAHEIAHVIHGHHRSTEQSTTVAVPSVNDASSILFSRDAEFEADVTGEQLVALTTQGAEYDLLAVEGAYVLMKAVELLELCRAAVGDATAAEHSTHPPAAQRAVRLRRARERAQAADRLRGELLLKIDQLFFWIARIALAHIETRKAKGEKPRDRVRLAVSAGYDRPAILGFLVQEDRPSV